MRTAFLSTTMRTSSSASSGGAVGALMNDLRTWLDHERIEPTDFVPVRLASGHLAFDLRFQHEQQAVLFAEAFGVSGQETAANLLLAA